MMHAVVTDSHVKMVGGVVHLLLGAKCHCQGRAETLAGHELECGDLQGHPIMHWA
jgi:hypothetical protein